MNSFCYLLMTCEYDTNMCKLVRNNVSTIILAYGWNHSLCGRCDMIDGGVIAVQSVRLAGVISMLAHACGVAAAAAAAAAGMVRSQA